MIGFGKFWGISAASKFFVTVLILVTAISISAAILQGTQTKTLQNLWQTHERGAAKKTILLGLIRGTMGYNGMIHSLHSYFLSNNPIDLIEAHKALLELKVIISGYRSLGVTEDEENALFQLEVILGQYRKVIANIEYGGSLSGPDSLKQIIVNDQPAFKALNLLNTNLVNTRQSNVLKITQKIEGLSYSIIVSAIAISSVLIITLIGFSWFVRNRVTTPIDKLVKSFDSIDPALENDQKLPVRSEEWRDELDTLAQAGNKYLEAASTHLAERRKVEEYLVEAKEHAEAANKAKTNFLSSMSHELRTPMNAVLGFAQMMEIDPDTPLTTSQKNCIHHIMESGGHLMALIDKILIFSEVEDGTISFRLQAKNINDLINKSVEQLRSDGIEKTVEITNDISETENCSINIDEVGFNTIFQALLSNATLYNKAPIKIEVFSKILKGDTVRIFVKDNGLGIPAEKQSLVFAPFRRLGMENSSIPGTGVGLAIAKKLTKLLNGKIGFESNKDEGTTFWVEFPLLKDKDSQRLV
ncbi:MAG: HAMP domain-containing histidine kinase [Rhodospirillales bacterium]|nr:HAMP domain-containing histidine kinase [Rhodospirillales bacterium]